jgi:hypothetical protein
MLPLLMPSVICALQKRPKHFRLRAAHALMTHLNRSLGWSVSHFAVLAAAATHRSTDPTAQWIGACGQIRPHPPRPLLPWERNLFLCVISGFCRDVDENCVLLGYDNPAERTYQSLCTLNLELQYRYKIYSLTQPNWRLLLKDIFILLLPSTCFDSYGSHLQAELYYLKKVTYTIDKPVIELLQLCQLYIIIIIIIIIIKLQLGWHPVAAVRSTFTHKPVHRIQSTEHT